MRKTILLLLSIICLYGHAQLSWPTPQPEAKAGLRWWWPGSAVDQKNIRWNLEQYAKVGAGSVEITPIYGVQGNESHAIPFLSTEWMTQLSTVEETGRQYGILTDMSTGTGWPFGGPTTPIEEAACKVVFVIDTVVIDKVTEQPYTVDIRVKDEKERPYAKLSRVMVYPIEVSSYKGRCLELSGNVVDGQLQMLRLTGKWLVIAQYVSRTRQQVKRAAPGGAGYVIDHFDKTAVKHYLERFDQAFESSGTPYPHNFFNDSYEVYGANWTPTLLEEFKARRGYEPPTTPRKTCCQTTVRP